jgi:uncharacterized protein YndB with AHSA1/START domain
VADSTRGVLDVAEDGRFTLRFDRGYPCPPETLWEAITRPDRLSRWFDQMIDYGGSRLDFTEGADLLFVAKDDHLFPALHGRVLRVDSPRLLEYTWASQLLRWELEAGGDGGCRLIFTTFVELRGSAIAGASRWRARLDMLHAVVNGGESAASDTAPA